MTISLFQYNILLPDTFRILYLFPAALPESPLCGNIVTKQLPVPGAAGKPSNVAGDDILFEALSYTWGTTVAEDGLIIRILDQAVPITRNLYDALLHIRHVTEIRTLWIDQICINQDNTLERNLQVAMMSRIYQSAVRVLI